MSQFAHRLCRRLVATVAIFIACSATAAFAQHWQYSVKPGDTLWDLSEQYLLRANDWRRVQTLNSIDDPTKLRPGSKVRIPTAWLKMKPTSARVISLQGEAFRIDGSGRSRPLRVGLLVQQGSEIRTSADSNVTLRFTDQSELLLEANSTLRFERLESFEPLSVGRTHLRLDRGSVEADVKPDQHDAGTRFNIQTPAATLAVRGTEYRVRAADASPTVSEVLRGNVLASGSGGRVSVNAGFGVRVEEGRPPGRAVALLPAPDLEAVQALVDRRPGSIRIDLTPDVAGARLHVGADSEFSGLLFDQFSASGEIHGLRLPDGDYPARVRYQDKQRIEGHSREFTLVVNAEPEPPLMQAPQVDQIVRHATPEFKWAASGASYRFQVAANHTFNSLVIDEPQLASNQFTVTDALPAGSYHWRVATIADGNDIGPFSDAVPFEVRPAAEIPSVEPEADEGKMVFRWREGGPGQRYQFQLSNDYFFDKLLVDEIVDEPTITVQDLWSDKYYLRIRVIESDGYRGEFGAHQEIVVPLSDPWRVIVVPLGLLLLAL